jgi:hypothetical protein
MNHYGLLALVNKTLAIAYGYLERSGELEDRERARQFMMDSIRQQMRKGERRPLMLANRAIESYQKDCAKRRPPINVLTITPNYRSAPPHETPRI